MLKKSQQKYDNISFKMIHFDEQLMCIVLY